MGTKSDKIAFVLSFVLELGSLCMSAAPDSRAAMPALSGPLAVGGMIQGLLNMQVRPEGGFFEEKYIEIFKDADKLPTAEYESLLNVNIDELLKNKEGKVTLSEDGKSLRSYVRGRSSNPCFEFDRITRNRLLALVCSLQLRKNPSLVWIAENTLK